ncbi:hypothetical protein [Kitasatospora sp. NPDC050543]|uniref:hypothetical protein n=1 Tax=Kitasatospora sp. NPDC050543 TaxID=3364054 RepID=UPI0037A7CE59
MATLIIFLCGSAGLVAGLTALLARRGARPTQNIDGVLAERERSAQAHAIRSSYSSVAMHSTHGLISDDLGRYVG